MCRKHYIDFFDYRFNKAAYSCIAKKKRQNSDGYMRSAFFVRKFVYTVVLKYLAVRGESSEALRIPTKVSIRKCLILFR